MKKNSLPIKLLIPGLFLATVLAVAFLALPSFSLPKAEAATNDKIPPQIFNSQVGEVTATSAVIVWNTDEDSDSMVNYGLNRNYGVARDPFYDKKEHKIFLDDLAPDTTYYFRMISTDKDGNQTISSDFTFNTVGTIKEEQVSEQEGQSPGPSTEPGQFPGPSITDGKFEMPSTEQVTVEQLTQILQQVSQVTSEKVLEIIQQQIQAQSQSQSVQDDKLQIIFDQVDVETGVDYAIIRWKTNKDSNTIVSLVDEASFNAEASNPYAWSEGKFDEKVTEHELTVNGLDPATIYHFQVSSETDLGQKSISTDNVFVTKSVLPEIYNISIAKIEEDSATITFTTNIPCASLLEYTNLDNGDTRMEGSTAYTTIHTVRLTGLKYDTYYSAMITVENEYGEKTKSSPITFLTIKDEIPPVVSKVKTESTLYPGSDNKVQTIVSWETDEQAICKFFFHMGLTAPEKVDELPIEKDLTQKHTQVTTNLLPSTVYKFWVECYDDVSNKSRSSDFIILTPSREENIIDIIMKNFEGTFGWVKKMGK